MSCQYGSQKRDGAVDLLNPNDIGVLCALFGLQGGLCRILDLVPSAVKKIAKLNPDIRNEDEIFGEILKKLIRTSYRLVIDELTNQIDVSKFCASGAPNLPESITYYDVYNFIADLVPILNYFFATNNILTGNSTKLLSKIVDTWLYQKWYENCECKTQESTPYIAPVPLPKIGYNSGCADIPNSIVDALNAQIEQLNNTISNGALSLAVSNASSKTASDQARERNIAAYIRNGFSVDNIRAEEQEVVMTNPSQSSFGQGCLAYYLSISSRSEKRVIIYCDLNGTSIANGFVAVNLKTQIAGYVVGRMPITTGRLDASDCECPPEVPPPPPQEFIDLFPDDPFSSGGSGNGNNGDGNNGNGNNGDGGNPTPCNSIDIQVVEFSGCGSDRSTKSVQLFNSGNSIDIQVVEFSGCGSDRSTKSVQLFNCP